MREMTTQQANEYFASIGARPQIMQANPERRARWNFLMEGAVDTFESDLEREYMAVGKGSPDSSTRDYARIQTEIMLESELLRVVNEELKDPNLCRLRPEQIFENMTTADVSPFTRFSLPLIRRVTPRTYARSLVNIQAMPQPTGKIFYLDVRYGNNKAPTVAGDRVDLVANFNNHYAGGKNTVEASGDGATVLFDLADGGTSDVVAYIDGLVTTAFTVNVGAGLNGVDQVQFNVAPANGTDITIIYDNYAEGSVAKEIDLTMSSSTIEAEDWALRGSMTVQSLQDFQSYHGISAEGEITAALAGEIDREIDFTIVQRLLQFGTGGNTNWDSTGFLPGDTTTTAQQSYRKTLYEAIISTSNLIYSKRFLNPTWIVGGVGAIERLEKLEEFKLSNTPSAPDDATVSRNYEGTLAGKFQVFKDARFPNDKLLMGYKGASPFHSGATFAPYIPAYMTDLLPDPSINFEVRKGLMSRNGFKITIPECYGTVTIV